MVRKEITARSAPGRADQGSTTLARTPSNKDTPPTPPTVWLVALGVFVLAFASLFSVYSLFPILYDADAYYHLAIAREYAQHGIIHGLPWARFSLMRDGFGDKEFLFHLLLAPFAALPDAELGGRIALALLGALILAGLAVAASRTLGAWALLVPFALFFGSLDTAWRLVRLRPELLSLLLLGAFLVCAAHQRDRLCGLLGALYALSYTAFQTLLGLAFFLFLLDGWRERGWRFGLLLYCMLGVAAGLLLHPQFPANLQVWAAQNVAFFALKDSLDVGTEIGPHPLRDLVLLNLGWFLGALALWRSARPDEGPAPASSPTAARLADSFGLAAAVFGLLYLFMSRFSIYAFPLATAWLLFELHRRGLRPSRWVALGGRLRLPSAVALAAAALLAAPQAWSQAQTFARRTSAGPHGERAADRLAWADAVPAGARIAAPWRATPIYMFFAPQGRYLNLLDPVFMALPHPEAYAAERAIFAGDEPDVPLVAATALDSDYLAYSLASESPVLSARLENDPRVETVYRGINVFYRLLPQHNESFIRDWTHEGGAVLTPLRLDPRAAAFAGYVDARRIGGTECVVLEHVESVSTAASLSYEFAPYGPGTLWIDGAKQPEIGADSGAVLGHGQSVEVPLAAGLHRFRVRTCPDSTRRFNGFFLLSREVKRNDFK